MNSIVRRVVLAHPNRDYAAKLADYLRETEPGWEVSAFTHEAALRLRLQEAAPADLLAADPAMLRAVSPLPPGVRRAAALTAESVPGTEWPTLTVYQPLPGVAAGMRELIAEPDGEGDGGCRWLTMFSASGGEGKTTAALNLVRLAGERGWRTLYLNLETLNATAKLFGTGEPDSFSRLLYAIQDDPEAAVHAWGGFVRRQPFLRADFVDAPDHPGERSAMTPELLGMLADAIRRTGRYNLVVADPDSGGGPWHRRLLELSDKIAWLVTDDWQSRDKAARLLRHWRDEGVDVSADRVALVRNRSLGGYAGRWELPVPPAAALPYVPQWKGMEDPGRLFGSMAYCGALERLLAAWGWIEGG